MKFFFALFLLILVGPAVTAHTILLDVMVSGVATEQQLLTMPVEVSKVVKVTDANVIEASNEELKSLLQMDFNAFQYISRVGIPCPDDEEHTCFDVNMSISEKIDYTKCVAPIEKGGFGFPEKVCAGGPLAIRDWNNSMQAAYIRALLDEHKKLQKQTFPVLDRRLGSLESSLTNLFGMLTSTFWGIVVVMGLILFGAIGKTVYDRYNSWNTELAGKKMPVQVEKSEEEKAGEVKEGV